MKISAFIGTSREGILRVFPTNHSSVNLQTFINMPKVANPLVLREHPFIDTPTSGHRTVSTL